MEEISNQGRDYSEAELDEIWAQFEAEGDQGFPEELQTSDPKPETPTKNLKIAIEDEILTIRADLRLIESESRSGRSWVISSSEGNMKLFDRNGFRDEVLNFSVTRRKEGVRPMRWYTSG